VNEVDSGLGPRVVFRSPSRHTSFCARLSVFLGLVFSRTCFPAPKSSPVLWPPVRCVCVPGQRVAPWSSRPEPNKPWPDFELNPFHMPYALSVPCPRELVIASVGFTSHWNLRRFAPAGSNTTCRLVQEIAVQPLSWTAVEYLPNGEAQQNPHSRPFAEIPPRRSSTINIVDSTHTSLRSWPHQATFPSAAAVIGGSPRAH